VTSAHHNEDNNPCEMLSDAVHIRRDSSVANEVPILQAEAFGAVNPSFATVHKETHTDVCARTSVVVVVVL